MPEAARILDPITHTEALPEAKSGMWSGIWRGVVMGAKIVLAAAAVTAVVALAAGAEVFSAGTATPFVVGALLVVGGMAARYGSAGFVDGAIHGQQTTNVHGHIRTGSLNVFINKRAAAIACGSEVDCDQHANARIATGSDTVSINGKRSSRKGDIGVCAFIISDGSLNVIIGGGRGKCADIEGEISQSAQRWAKVAFWGGTFAALVGGLMMGGGKPTLGGSVLAGLKGLANPGVFLVAGLSLEMGYFASERNRAQGGSLVDQMEAGDNASLITSLLGTGIIKGGPPTLRALDELAGSTNFGGLQPAYANGVNMPAGGGAGTLTGMPPVTDTPSLMAMSASGPPDTDGIGEQPQGSESETNFRQRIDEAEARGDTQAADDVRYQRYLHDYKGDGEPLSREGWQPVNDQMNANRIQGRVHEDAALDDAGVENNNYNGTSENPREITRYRYNVDDNNVVTLDPNGSKSTRPDGITDTKVVDVKSVKPGVQTTQDYETQLRAEKAGALSENKDLAVVLSNDDASLVRPSGPLSDNALVLHRDVNTSEWSRWNPRANSGDGGWTPIPKEEATRLLGGTASNPTGAGTP